MIDQIVDDKCCTVESDQFVQREQKGKVFRLRNNARKSIKCCLVDGCLLVGTGKKCDYLFLVGTEELYLVELKGTSHVHALRQLIESAENLRLDKIDLKKFSAIVSAPCPKTSTTYQNELKRLGHRFKKAGLEFPKKKNRLLEVTVS